MALKKSDKKTTSSRAAVALTPVPRTRPLVRKVAVVAIALGSAAGCGDDDTTGPPPMPVDAGMSPPPMPVDGGSAEDAPAAIDAFTPPPPMPVDAGTDSGGPIPPMPPPMPPPPMPPP